MKEEAANHLRVMLDGMADAGGYLELRAFDEKNKDEKNSGNSLFVPVNATDDDLDAAVKWLSLESKRGRGVFVGVNPRVRESGHKKDVERFTTVFLDLDTEKAKVSREDAIAAIRDESPIAPSLISDSGGGLHVLYFMKPTDDYFKWKDIQETLYEKFKDYGADRSVVTDSSRVLRLTPFPNWKYDKDSGGRPTGLVAFTPREITPSVDSIVELFDVKRGAIEKEQFRLPDTIAEGEGRNTLLFKEASALRNRGMGETELFAALSGINQVRCIPPLEAEELTRIVKNAMRYTPTQEIGAGEDFSLSRIGIGGESVNSFGYKFGEFVQVQFPPLEWIIYGLNNGELGEIVATPNVGKTTIMLGLEMSMAAGREYYPLYEGGRPRRVMYLDFENRGAFLQKDVQHMVQNFSPDEQDLIAENLFIAVDQEIYGQEMNLSNPDHLEIVAKEALLHRAELIVIDTMAAAFSLQSENDNSEMEKVVIKPLKQLARASGAAILVVHHKGKSGETADRSPLYAGRGASAMAAAARLVLTLEPLKDGSGRTVEGHVVLKSPKVKGAPMEDTILELDFQNRWFNAANIVLPDDTSNHEMIWSFVTRPMKLKEIKEAVKQAGHVVSDSTISRVLKLGLSTGRLQRGDVQGVYAPGEVAPDPESVVDGEIVAEDNHDDAVPLGTHDGEEVIG
jgi:hypothetical protein